MSLAFIFWFIMLVWVLGCTWHHWPTIGVWYGINLLEFILFALIGWKIFGSPVRKE